MLAMLNEYVDGTVDPAICDEFEKHMAGCNPCQVVVDNIRQTITLYQNGQPYELSVKFREQLHEALRQGWMKTRAANPGQSYEVATGIDTGGNGGLVCHHDGENQPTESP